MTNQKKVIVMNRKFGMRGDGTHGSTAERVWYGVCGDHCLSFIILRVVIERHWQVLLSRKQRRDCACDQRLQRVPKVGRPQDWMTTG
jgi:hypothetical protein